MRDMKTTKSLFMAAALAALALISAAFAQTPPEGVDEQQWQQFQQFQQMQQQQQEQQPPPQQAPQQETNLEQRAKVSILIRDGIIKNKEAIRKESASLSYLDREALYKKNRYKAAFGWASLNFFPGFGLGSYIQGDKSSGIIQSVLDGGGLLFMFSGVLLAVEVDEFIGGAIAIPGYIAIVAGRITGVIFPFSFQKKGNQNLREALNYDNIAYSIDPLFVPRKDGIPAVGFGFNVRY
jgi:hypothetical protein